MGKKVDDELNGRLKESKKKDGKRKKKGSENNISIYSVEENNSLVYVSQQTVGVSPSVRSRERRKENNFSIHKNLQNIRKNIKTKIRMKAAKKHIKKSRKMLQLIKKRAERRKKMKNS